MGSVKFKVAGVTQYQENILSLGEENEDFGLTNRELIDCYCDGEKVNEYLFFPEEVRLIPEQENEYDPNAVRVEIDGVHVGYIKKGSCTRAKNLLASPEFCGIQVESMGIGRYKQVWEDDHGKNHVETGDHLPWVHIEILTESEEERKEAARKIREQQEAAERKAKEENKKIGKRGNFYFVFGVILYVLSLLLIVLYPLIGFVFSLATIGYIYYGKWLKNGKKSPEKPAWIFILMAISFVVFLLRML